MRFHRLLPLVVLLVISSSLLFTQTVIRERVEIVPRKAVAAPNTAYATSSQTLLYTLDSLNAANTISGVEVGVAGMTFSISSMPDQSGVDIFLQCGSCTGGGLLRSIYKDCSGIVRDTTYAFPPLVLNGCSSVYVLYKQYYYERFFQSCLKRSFTSKAAKVVSAGGSSATFQIADNMIGYFGSFPFTATVTVAATPLPGRELASVRAVLGKTTLLCVDNTTTAVSLVNELGQTVTLCGSATLPVTASLEGVGPYAYLRQGALEGSSINFSMTTASSSFEVVLDTSRGVIPLGLQVATLRTIVDGVETDTTITLRCDYPPPGVTITYPGQDTTIILTTENQPIITLQEEHSPTSGQFEPTIHWQPTNVLHTTDYYQVIEDSVVLDFAVSALNVALMQSIANRKITLKKEGCNLQVTRYAQGGVEWGNDHYDNAFDENGNPKTIAGEGCALSSLAMVMTTFGVPVDPGALNTWKKGHSYNEGGYLGSKVAWGVVKKYVQGRMSFEYTGKDFPKLSTISNLSVLDDPLQNCKLIIVQVYNTKGQHWVVVTGKENGRYKIVDPGGRNEQYLDQYGNFWSYVIITKK